MCELSIVKSDMCVCVFVFFYVCFVNVKKIKKIKKRRVKCFNLHMVNYLKYK
jgi:hypothetical protein